MPNGGEIGPEREEAVALNLREHARAFLARASSALAASSVLRLSSHSRSSPRATRRLAVLLAAPASALDLDELTVVTLAHDGSWGVATADSTGKAIRQAAGRGSKPAGPRFRAQRFAITHLPRVVVNRAPQSVGTRRVLTVDPAGTVAPTGSRYSARAKIGRPPP